MNECTMQCTHKYRVLFNLIYQIQIQHIQFYMYALTFPLEGRFGFKITFDIQVSTRDVLKVRRLMIKKNKKTYVGLLFITRITHWMNRMLQYTDSINYCQNCNQTIYSPFKHFVSLRTFGTPFVYFFYL